MADTYTSLFYHFVFSAKNRVGYIKPEIEQRVWEYIGGIARENKMSALQVGGIEDHIYAQPGLEKAGLGSIVAPRPGIY